MQTHEGRHTNSRVDFASGIDFKEAVAMLGTTKSVSRLFLFGIAAEAGMPLSSVCACFAASRVRLWLSHLSTSN